MGGGTGLRLPAMPDTDAAFVDDAAAEPGIFHHAPWGGRRRADAPAMLMSSLIPCHPRPRSTLKGQTMLRRGQTFLAQPMINPRFAACAECYRQCDGLPGRLLTADGPRTHSTMPAARCCTRRPCSSRLPHARPCACCGSLRGKAAGRGRPVALHPPPVPGLAARTRK